MSDPLRLAVLISGSGTTLLNILDKIHAGALRATVARVIASRDNIVGVERARSAGLRVEIVPRRQYPDVGAFSNAVFSHCLDAQLVCLAGWLSLLKAPEQFAGRVMNIHPALLPSFGGPGMYGHFVHEAVLAHGCKVSGCTVHFVNDAYDAGPIILQRCCPVLDDDTPATLAARVFEEEKIAYPQAISLFGSGRLQTAGRVVHVSAKDHRG